MLRITVSLLMLLAGVAAPAVAVPVALDGSRASMLRQHRVAESSDYTFLRTAADVRRFVESGYLVPVEGNADYVVDDGVSFPYARPELKLFLERLSAQHREGCGGRLVVTSLTRPTTGQPSNSHPLSVHPAGMAVDLRVHEDAGCREWLESALLSLEARDLLDVTREHHPPHYHVALFTSAYREYVQPLLAADSARAAEEARLAEEEARRAAAERLASASAFVAPEPGVATASTAGSGWSLAALPLVGLALGLGWVRRKRSASRDG